MRDKLPALILALIVFGVLAWPLDVAVWLAALAGVGSYVAVSQALKPRLRIAHIERHRLPAGNDDELKELMRDAAEDMKAIETAGKAIVHPSLKSQVEKLHGIGIRILGYLSTHPERITTARKFLGYYLDTARNIVEKYLMFEESGLETEEVKRIRASTERALPILNTAFEKQFTRLMANDLMDVEADIKLLETSLKMDGDA